MESASLRNLEQIQERDPSRRGSHLSTLILASISGACVVFAVLALAHRPGGDTPGKPDPLAELVDNTAAAVPAPALHSNDVSFPNLLSDEPNPTTAMATLRGGTPTSSAALPFVLPPGSPTEPPPATDRLPVVPLPAQNYLSLSPVVTQPRDSLTAMANLASTPTGEQEAAPGQSGGFQLQVSSFRKENTAEKFAVALRQRGHRAHVESAMVKGKGTWYRVRVGPFRSKHEAIRYRKEFEQREHIVTFIVEPDGRALNVRD